MTQIQYLQLQIFMQPSPFNTKQKQLPKSIDSNLGHIYILHMELNYNRYTGQR